MELGEAIEKTIEKIEELKIKLNKYREQYSGNETLVRYSLIDPFLRMIGWDTSDPSQVIPEYSTGNGRADYALFGSDGNIINAFHLDTFNSIVYDTWLVPSDFMITGIAGDIRELLRAILTDNA